MGLSRVKASSKQACLVTQSPTGWQRVGFIASIAAFTQ
jgi:hypothetical protein